MNTNNLANNQSKEPKGLDLKAFRERLKLTQEEMAAELDVPKPTYQGWEIRRTEPPVKVIRKLFGLGATVRELFCIDYSEEPVRTNIDANDPVFLAEVAKAVSKLVNNGHAFIKNAAGGIIHG
jgi:transcriptional regulator with XRE-family HTH domain